MKDRIRQLMESQHMTQQTFANFLGMSAASLSSIFNERTKPTLNTIEAIKSKIPAISLDWLMFGKGPMFESEQSIHVSQPDAPAATSREQTLDFVSPSAPLNGRETNRNVQGVYPTLNNYASKDVIYVDKPQRQITEIRIFYDDQTWETFVPKK